MFSCAMCLRMLFNFFYCASIFFHFSRFLFRVPYHLPLIVLIAHIHNTLSIQLSRLERICYIPAVCLQHTKIGKVFANRTQHNVCLFKHFYTKNEFSVLACDLKHPVGNAYVIGIITSFNYTFVYTLLLYACMWSDFMLHALKLNGIDLFKQINF